MSKISIDEKDLDEKRNEESTSQRTRFEVMEPRMNTLRKHSELSKKWNLDTTHASATFKLSRRWKEDEDVEKFVVWVPAAPHCSPADDSVRFRI